ncbi:MAG: BolA family transcriptional regulator [Candidatus Binatia bacterium]|nr:BolA family transcriptional regulator [Candidatus Binatia bacterium]
MTRSDKIEDKLKTALTADHVEVEDDSARHAGHAGASGGAGHFNVIVVAAQFEGRNRVARHRAVYAALDDMMPTEIHALSARTFTPAEWRGQS